MSEILKIGIPTLVFQLLTSLSITLINLQTKGYGDSVIAGMGVVTRIISMGSLMVFGFMKGFQPIAGYSGTVEEGESFEQALLREVREETGLSVKPDSITELGEIEEIHRDRFLESRKYICHSFYYRCEVWEEVLETDMTAQETNLGYHLEWASIQQIVSANFRLLKETWEMRDTLFFKLLLDNPQSIGL